jgi:hypothetical protein
MTPAMLCHVVLYHDMTCNSTPCLRCRGASVPFHLEYRGQKKLSSDRERVQNLITLSFTIKIVEVAQDKYNTIECSTTEYNTTDYQ